MDLPAGRDQVGVRELRNQVAAVLRRARTGERVVITVDGVPAAQIGPVEPTGAPSLTDLVATGLVLPPRRDRPDEPPPYPLPVDVRLDRVLESLRGG